jgi:hypothetical protein
MNYFEPVTTDNIASQLDLWLRDQRSQGLADEVILESLAISIERLVDKVREERLDRLQDFTPYDVQDAYQEGRNQERKRQRKKRKKLKRKLAEIQNTLPKS